MATNGHNLIVSAEPLPTTCKLCGKIVVQLKGISLEIPLSGPPGEKGMDYLKVLLKHMTKHHPDALLNHAKEFEEMQAWFLLTAFHHTDPSVEPRMEQIRRLLFSQCRRYSFTDEALHQLADKLDYTIPLGPQIEALLKSVRDILTETAHVPAPKESSRIVTLQ